MPPASGAANLVVTGRCVLAAANGKHTTAPAVVSCCPKLLCFSHCTFNVLQIEVLKQQREEKDKEARAQTLVAKAATKKVEEAKAAAAKQSAAFASKLQEAAAAAAQQQKQLADSAVHLMLCVIVDTTAQAPAKRCVSVELWMVHACQDIESHWCVLFQ